MNIKSLLTTLLAACAILLFNAQAAEKKELPQTLFTNVNIFNGTASPTRFMTGMSVLVEGNLIKADCGFGDRNAADADTTVIDGGGRTLMPGFIEDPRPLDADGANTCQPWRPNSDVGGSSPSTAPRWPRCT